MKVKKDHYNLIKQYLTLAIEEKGPKTFEDHWRALPTSNPKPKDCARRFRWDCFWCAQNTHRAHIGVGFPVVQWDYKDDHLDTALRALMVELNLPQ
jgi:hypothetical protein